ncbi:MAG: MerR family transcriptional regulator [Candidatus Cohnella colombiensis]|uniref:MerR family transcriptional regulator n=1 Tax=Candidatus Cohnella colombiensis TaxID=3121368 RepID=A0AA95JAK3_9BACL|nr:MAG: MerR family transcriptional regulator [Cohnella sp.]
MEYTVQKLAQLAGVSTRTLRYYDQMDILKPARVNSSGYRIYGTVEVDRLQHILFYRELGVSLENIKEMMNDPSFHVAHALKLHHEQLLHRREQLDVLIANVEKTIASYEGGIPMSDHEKFEGFKQKQIDDNEQKYGQEIREKYGDDAVNTANDKLKSRTIEQQKEVTELEQQIKNALAQAYLTGDPASALAQQSADLHRQWLSHYWVTYSKEAHRGIAQMYVEDERFKAYYDELQPGTAQFLHDAILIYTTTSRE